MKVKEESEKTGLKFNIQKTKIMASGPITSWQIDGETKETVIVIILWQMRGFSWKNRDFRGNLRDMAQAANMPRRKCPQFTIHWCKII